MPRGDNFRGKRSMNPAARSIVPQGVHDGRTTQDRRRTKKYGSYDLASSYEAKFRRPDDVGVGEFEDQLIGKLDKQDVAADLQAKQARRKFLNAYALAFQTLVEETANRTTGLVPTGVNREVTLPEHTDYGVHV